MTRPAVPAAALALVLAAAPTTASQALSDPVDEPGTPVAVETVDVPQTETAPSMDGAPDMEPAAGDESVAAEVTAANRVVTDGYQNDGYVNINVPGAQNLSIDSHRELIGAAFVPWSYFDLKPGMCISWTESNGYNYHFGEDNSGRDGVNENGWQYCVPSDPTPDPTRDPSPDPTPDPEPVNPAPVGPVPVPPDPVAPQVVTQRVVTQRVVPAPAPESVTRVAAVVPLGRAVPSPVPSLTVTHAAEPSQHTSTQAPAPVLAMTGARPYALALIAAGVVAFGGVLWDAARRHRHQTR